MQLKIKKRIQGEIFNFAASAILTELFNKTQDWSSAANFVDQFIEHLT